MSKSLWQIRDDIGDPTSVPGDTSSRGVYRIDVLIATIGPMVTAKRTYGIGKFRWEGMGIERYGFNTEEEVLADVKYYYTLRQRQRKRIGGGKCV